MNFKFIKITNKHLQQGRKLTTTSVVFDSIGGSLLAIMPFDFEMSPFENDLKVFLGSFSVLFSTFRVTEMLFNLGIPFLTSSTFPTSTRQPFCVVAPREI